MTSNRHFVRADFFILRRKVMNRIHQKRPRIKREKDAVVAGNIKKYRSLNGMSQEKLAKILGVTFQQFQKYESAVNRVSAGTIYEISLALNIPILWLFYDEEDYSKMPKDEKPIFDDEEIKFVTLLRKSKKNIRTAIFNILKNC